MPFVHLEREIWDLRDGSGAEIGPDAPERGPWLAGRGAAGRLRPGTEQLLADPGTLAAAARLLLDLHFTPGLAAMICDAVGLDLAVLELAASPAVATARRRLRRPGFAEEVLRAYAYQCAMSGLEGALDFARSSRELKDPQRQLRDFHAPWVVVTLGFAGAGGVVVLGGGLQELAGDGRVLDGGGVVDAEHGGEVEWVGTAGEGFLSCRSARSRSRVVVARGMTGQPFSLTARVVMAVCWLTIRCGLAVPGQRRPRCRSQARSRRLVRSSSGRALPVMTSRRLPRLTSPR